MIVAEWRNVPQHAASTENVSQHVISTYRLILFIFFIMKDEHLSRYLDHQRTAVLCSVHIQVWANELVWRCFNWFQH